MTRHTITRVAAGFLIACLAAPAPVSPAEDFSAVVTFLKGLVRVQEKGSADFVSLSLGQRLKEGDTVVTLDDSRIELKMTDGSSVRLGSRTEFTLRTMSRNRMGGIKAVFDLVAGRFWFNINKLTGDAEVMTHTASVVTAVKGTVYRADVGEDGKTDLVVYDGVVTAGRKAANEVELKSMESLAALPRAALEKASYDESTDDSDDWIRWNKNRDKIRIMIVLPETRGEERALASVSENTAMEAFMRNYLFKVIEKEQVDRIRESAKLKAALKGDAAAAAAAGLEVAADVIVVGEATVKYFKGKIIGDMVSATANLTARTVRADTAEVIAAAAGLQARKVDITDEGAAQKALMAVGGELADKFMEEILAKWRRELRKGADIDVIVDGVDFGTLTTLTNDLAKLAGVKNVERLYLVGRRALLSVTFEGDATGLAEAISKDGFGGRMNVSVVGLTGYRLELEVSAAAKKEAGS